MHPHSQLKYSNFNYPFGMMMPGRNEDDGSSYRYSFQGQEKDDEIKGEGNSINYRFRIHDPRVGRFFAVDPLEPKYPHNGPYNFSENKVIHAIELEGLEAWEIKRDWEADDEAKFQVFVAERIVEMQESKTKYDCADFAVTLLVEYAAQEGLNVSFTNINGSKISADDEMYKDIGMDAFLKLVNESTDAESIRNDMKQLDPGESPEPGDMTNNGFHVNVVREEDDDEILGVGVVPTASGSLPARVPKNEAVWDTSEFLEWIVIDSATTQEEAEAEAFEIHKEASYRQNSIPPSE